MLTELFHGILILQLLNLAQNQSKDNPFKSPFPKDIIDFIIKILITSMSKDTIELYVNYIKRNQASLSKNQPYMRDFLFLYSLMEKHIRGSHTFFSDNENEHPDVFYSMVNRHSAKEKEGLTAFTKSVLKTHKGNINRENHELVDTLFNHCIKKKSLYNTIFSSNDDIKKDIETSLASKSIGL